MSRSPGRTGRAWRDARTWVLAHYTHCWICHQPVNTSLNGRRPDGPSVDHVHALSRGGDPLDYDNLRLAHTGCNSRRGDGSRTRRRSRAW